MRRSRGFVGCGSASAINGDCELIVVARLTKIRGERLEEWRHRNKK